jgi:hypothetical protein
MMRITSVSVPSSCSSLTVCHHQKQTFNHANGLPAPFSVLGAVLNRNTERIAEYVAGFFKAHAMLAAVGAIPGLVPLESHGSHIVIVSINM